MPKLQKCEENQWPFFVALYQVSHCCYSDYLTFPQWTNFCLMFTFIVLPQEFTSIQKLRDTNICTDYSSGSRWSLLNHALLLISTIYIFVKSLNLVQSPVMMLTPATQKLFLKALRTFNMMVDAFTVCVSWFWLRFQVCFTYTHTYFSSDH